MLTDSFPRGFIAGAQNILWAIIILQDRPVIFSTGREVQAQTSWWFLRITTMKVYGGNPDLWPLQGLVFPRILSLILYCFKSSRKYCVPIAYFPLKAFLKNAYSSVGAKAHVILQFYSVCEIYGLTYKVNGQLSKELIYLWTFRKGASGKLKIWCKIT